MFQVGLSWAIVFAKRDAFRRAFRDFDTARVATMTARDADRLVHNNASIIRSVGPTSVYAFMQNVGVVNDHVHGCFRASE